MNKQYTEASNKLAYRMHLTLNTLHTEIDGMAQSEWRHITGKWVEQKKNEIGSRMRSATKSSHTICLVYTLFSLYFFRSSDRRRHVRAYACVYDCAYFIGLAFIQLFIYYMNLSPSRSPALSHHFESFARKSDARARTYGMWCHSWKSSRLYNVSYVCLFVCVSWMSQHLFLACSTPIWSMYVCVCVILCAWVEIQRRLNSYGNAADILYCEIFKNVKCNIVRTQTALRRRNARVAVFFRVVNFSNCTYIYFWSRLQAEPATMRIFHILLNKI